MINPEELIGKTFDSVNGDKGDSSINFCIGGKLKYELTHHQDCCEDVDIDDIIGDLKDLENSPITMSEIITNNENPKDKNVDSFTWTFCKFATIKGFVTIKFYGTSNGYYSETAELYHIGD